MSNSANEPMPPLGQPLSQPEHGHDGDPATASHRPLWQTLLLVGLSLFFSLLLAEGLVRLADALGWVNLAPSLVELPAPEQGEDQVVVDETGNTPLYIADSKLHHRMAPNWSGFFPEEITQQVGRSKVPIRTNSLGLRSAEVAQPKPKDVQRILVLGDSVAFGWGLRGEDTFASQLASRLGSLRPGQRFEVVNAGVSGYGTWQEAQWLDESGMALEPDVVVVQVHLNDAADNLWGALAWNAGDGGSSWLVRNSMLARLVSRIAGGGQAALPGRQGGPPCSDDWKVELERVCWERTEALLADIQETAAARGAVVVLMPAPMRWQVEPGVRDPRIWVDAAAYQQSLGEFAASRPGWLFVDPLPAIQAASQGGQSLFLDVGHPNEEGHRIIAEEIYSAIDEAGVLE